jgi:hypothetical protein
MSEEESMESNQMSPAIVAFITCEPIHSPDRKDLKTECLEMIQVHYHNFENSSCVHQESKPDIP